MMNKIPSISIIGPGKVGSVLGITAHLAGINVLAIGGRSLKKTKACAERISPSTNACSCEEAAELGDIVFLTVSDDAISSLCKKLASNKNLKQGSVIVHCSGALSSTELESAKQLRDCAIASFHPFMSFSNIEKAIENFSEAYCFMEGSDLAIKELLIFGKKIGLQTEIILTKNKITYHAAAVFSLNFLTTIINASFAVGKVAGIEENSLKPALIFGIKNLINNIDTLGPAKALSGPIVRGDMNLVQKQLSDLSSKDAKLGNLYSLLSKHTAELAHQAGKISAKQLSSFLEILKQ